MTLTKGITTRLADIAAEGARRNHEQRIAELQALPAASLRVVQGVSLASGVETPVPHRLGRAPLWVGPSAPRGGSGAGTGVVTDVGQTTAAGTPIDRSQVVVLRANGYGGTITVDVAFL